ncbi:vWA domain-containing protein [Corynebacterium cystitidis]|uniref:vWA domain-containing protein n=1 Tax=Corynebacterium cystitidis TaxID=35757 RepID=UPI00211ECFB9|nr:vWA domain-containing protein [Corynebacterium cystitidis]
MKKSVSRSVAALAAGGLIAASAAFGMGGAVGQEPTNSGLAQLGSCIADQGTLDVVLLIDESGSLAYEVKDGVANHDAPGSDPEANRVAAAQSFIDQLVARQERGDMTANVRIAGFGQDYKSGATDPENYGEWIKLDAGSARQAKDEIAQFADRTNEDYTNYANALAGAYDDLTRSGSENPCRMVVTFTDGELTSDPGVMGAEETQDELCRPGGVTDRLRASGITNVGIGLSAPHVPSDFSLMRGLTEGTGTQCGELGPNGAFFEADNVGSLFTAFRQALLDGGDVTLQSNAFETMEVTLDDSITSMRVSVIAQDDLGEHAYVTVTAPNGEVLELRDTGEQQFAGAEVRWESTTDPTVTADADMVLPEGQSWAGVWSFRFDGYDENSADGRVMSIVEMQPGIRVDVSGPEASEQSTVEVNNEQDLTLTLVDNDGQQRPMAGSARSSVTFYPEGGNPQVLAEDLDLTSGQATIPVADIDNLPAVGRIETVTQVVTDGDPGTALTPFVNSTQVSASLQNLPKVSGGIVYTSEQETFNAEIPVTGPGLVWIEPGTTVASEFTPEGIGEIAVSSQHNSQDTALQLKSGEQASLPVELSIAELADGIVTGSVPVAISDVDKQEGPLEVSVPVEATYSVPLNTTKFVGATIAAILLGILIPLGILYLVRYITNTIPKKDFGAVTVNVEDRGGPLLYNGHNQLTMDSAAANASRIQGASRSFTAGGTTLRVKALSPNPLEAATVIADKSPSVRGNNGDHSKNRAQLPLAVQNEWFVAQNPNNPNLFDLTILPGLPFNQALMDQLAKEIESKLPARIKKLREMAADQQSAGSPPAGGQPGGPGPGGPSSGPSHFRPPNPGPGQGPGTGQGPGFGSGYGPAPGQGPGYRPRP